MFDDVFRSFEKRMRAFGRIGCPCHQWTGRARPRHAPSPSQIAGASIRITEAAARRTIGAPRKIARKAAQSLEPLLLGVVRDGSPNPTYWPADPSSGRRAFFSPGKPSIARLPVHSQSSFPGATSGSRTTSHKRVLLRIRDEFVRLPSPRWRCRIPGDGHEKISISQSNLAGRHGAGHALTAARFTAQSAARTSATQQQRHD